MRQSKAVAWVYLRAAMEPGRRFRATAAGKSISFDTTETSALAAGRIRGIGAAARGRWSITSTKRSVRGFAAAAAQVSCKLECELVHTRFE
jgi:hypothetical protein